MDKKRLKLIQRLMDDGSISMNQHHDKTNSSNNRDRLPWEEVLKNNAANAHLLNDLMSAAFYRYGSNYGSDFYTGVHGISGDTYSSEQFQILKNAYTGSKGDVADIMLFIPTEYFSKKSMRNFGNKTETHNTPW
jgi:hypothetical protein